MDLILQSIKSRTVRFGILMAVLSVLQGYIGFLPVSQFWQAVIGVGIASLIVIFRAVTTMPLSEK